MLDPEKHKVSMAMFRGRVKAPRRKGPGAPKGHRVTFADRLRAAAYDQLGKEPRVAASDDMDAQFVLAVKARQQTATRERSGRGINAALRWFSNNRRMRRLLSPHHWTLRTFTSLRNAHKEIDKDIKRDPTRHRLVPPDKHVSIKFNSPLGKACREYMLQDHWHDTQ